MQKDFRFEIKSVDEQGVFTGLASTYGNVDDGGDVVEPGAFAKDLRTAGNVRPLLWQHEAAEPIGTVTLTDTATGLACAGKLLLDLPTARKAYVLLKHRVIKGLSIGFQSVNDVYRDGARHLKEVKLFEISVVTLAMNQLATVEAVKRRDGDDGEALAIIASIRRDVQRLTS
jgi:HK97 family phage prohead protease